MKINASTLTTRHTLEIRGDGVEWCETAAFAGRRFFRFDQIDAVLRGAQLLSFQAGTETFSIPINAANPDHRLAAARLAAEAKRSVRKV